MVLIVPYVFLHWVEFFVKSRQSSYTIDVPVYRILIIEACILAPGFKTAFIYYEGIVIL